MHDFGRRPTFIFTFDGDAAGQKAALKAFRTDQDFAAQAFVAVAQSGLDPCDLRIQQGPLAVVELIENRRPLFDFVLQTIIEAYDLDNPAGRVEALRGAAPIVAEIRDKALRQAYVTRLGGWLGITDREAWHSVRAAEKWHQQSSRHNADFRAQRARSDSSAIPSTGIQVQLDPLIDTDPVLRLERDVLIAALRFPDLAAQTHFDSLTPDSFTQPTLRAVFEAILSSGGTKKYLELRDAAVQAGGNTPDKVALNRWAGGVKHEAGSILSAALTGLATRPVPVRQAEEAPSWVHSVVDSLERMSLNRRIGDLRARLNRLSSSDESREQVFSELIELENEKRQLDPEY